MKVAVLSDVHGNFPALQAVVRDLPPVDAVWCCGDMVGYYPDVNEVCECLQGLGVQAVRGNHDAYAAGWLTPDPARVDAYRTAWTKKALSPSHLRWLERLPVSASYRLHGLSITACHAAPWSDEEYLHPDSPAIRRLELRDDEWLIVGHTHRPAITRAGRGLLINPGSVGQPRDGNPQASYAVLDVRTAEVALRRVRYPVAPFQQRLASLAWEQPTIDILSREKHAE